MRYTCCHFDGRRRDPRCGTAAYRSHPIGPYWTAEPRAPLGRGAPTMATTRPSLAAQIRRQAEARYPYAACDDCLPVLSSLQSTRYVKPSRARGRSGGRLTPSVTPVFAWLSCPPDDGGDHLVQVHRLRQVFIEPERPKAARIGWQDAASQRDNMNACRRCTDLFE